MPDLVSSSASFDAMALRVSAERILAWSTTRPVSAGKLGAQTAMPVNNSAMRTTSGRARLPTEKKDEMRPAVIGAPFNRNYGASQNFTCGGVCALSFAANSAIGLLVLRSVEAHNSPGNVLRVVL